MNLNELAQFAVSNNFTGRNSTPLHELSIEEARDKVKVKDGNKKAAEDGSQALTLGFGKHLLPMDVVKKGATRINAAAEQVEGFTNALMEAVSAGEFDEAIIAAQAKAKAQAEAAKAAPKVEKAVEAVDMDALEALEDEDELPTVEEETDELEG